jgi:hypothetical protein
MAVLDYKGEKVRQSAAATKRIEPNLFMFESELI